ncbi:hypothetical protein Sjap_020697 [Stephania japonica]|uniref:XPG-I domain-containing protein n=1 Tax=Stephania japonica TaxID=461633 RepID=A0AAP0F6H9_9MAGN
MPVLKAASEADALCAQLNSEGHVDAVFTSDSDAFLYGAKCVIKCLHPNSKDPFECYHISDIEAGLGLKRMHLVAISLLVGNDHDMNGVPGIGIETALSFVRMFPEEDILNRLHAMGKGEFLLSLMDSKSPSSSSIPCSDENSLKKKSPHCSHCGHPGSKKAHLKVACEYCCVSGNKNCLNKAVGFRCECPSCTKDRSSKAHKKQENWMRRICSKIYMKKDFPNDEIIKMYLGHNQEDLTGLTMYRVVILATNLSSFVPAGDKSPCLSWRSSDVETVIDFLGYHQHWDPSYVRQRILPMLSTIFLREMASNQTEGSLLHEQYEFNSIQRVKIRYGHPFYLVSWRRVGPAVGSVCSLVQNEQVTQQEEFMEEHEQIDLLDEADVPEIFVDDGCWFLLTDENMDLIQAAFPKKEMKEAKLRKSKSISIPGDSETPKSRGVQLSITEFYRSSKVFVHGESPDENPHQGNVKVLRKGKWKALSPNLSKSVRRRMLFD